MNTQEEITKQLWDILRQQNCATGLKAFRIVTLSEEDIKKAVDTLLENYTIVHK